MALTRLRSDGRYEVADTAEANEALGCPLDLDCILAAGHDGECDFDREEWAGQDVPYPDPNLPLSHKPEDVEEWLST